MRDFSVRVVDIPNKLGPWNITLVVKLIQMFKKQGIVLTSKINDTYASFSFRLSAFFQVIMGLLLTFIPEFLHIQFLLALSKCS
jgi:hypothetical protein